MKTLRNRGSIILGSLTDFFRKVFEGVGTNLEKKIWMNRKVFIFLAVSMVILYPSSTIILPVLNRLDNIVILKGIMVLLFYGVIERLIFYRRDKNFVALGARLFASFGYFWIMIEMTINYSNCLLTFLSRFWDKAQSIQIIETLEPFLRMYTTLPGTKYGLIAYITFFTFYYGIGRNKSTFRFFIRYHYIQSLLLGALIGFQAHIFRLVMKLNPGALVLGNFVGTTFYSFAFLAILWCLITVIAGKETYLPLMHNSIQYHTGRKEDEGKKPLDL
jgi:hypothetical protein